MLTLLLVTLVAAPPQAAPEASTAASSDGRVIRLPARQCLAITVTPVLAPVAPTSGERKASGDAALPVLRRVPSFSAARTLDLRFKAVLARAVGPEARVELRLYTPRGYLYQSLRAPAPGDGGSPAPWTATLPVAGTSIVNSSLYGEWRIEPHLDGSPRPCGPALRFRITP
jgi:hypothetical protein